MEIVQSFFSNLTQGEVTYISAEDLKAFFESLGIDFGQLTEEHLAKLAKYSNKYKGPVVTVLIGKEKKLRFREWVQTRAAMCRWPHLSGESSKSNYEGFSALFYESLSYAAGAYDWSTFSERTACRVFNGRLRLGLVTGERRKILVPGHSSKPFAPASFPPQYPMELFMYLTERMFEK